MEKGASDAGARPGGIFISIGKRSRPIITDIKVAATLRKTRAARSARKPGNAARLWRMEKLRNYEQGCLSHGLDFDPMEAQALGGWVPKSFDAIRLLAEKKEGAREMEASIALY